MTKPQQPELARSGRGEVDPAAVKTRRGGPTDETPPTGAVPEANLPGHHPEDEQDKPSGPPPRPRARSATATKTKAQKAQKVEGEATATITDLTSARRDKADAHFRFAFERRMVPFALPLGITPWTTAVDVSDGELRVRFGPWSLKTPLDNVEGAVVTGPYSQAKVAGPPRLSLADRGLTMATSTQRGVCIRFREPVSVLVPKSLLRHPALTVTVEDPDALVEVLEGR